jgi:hypothetical protein
MTDGAGTQHLDCGGFWRGSRFVFGQRARPLVDPDMVLRVDRHAADLAHDPIVGQRLGPERIDFECGSFGVAGDPALTAAKTARASAVRRVKNGMKCPPNNFAKSTDAPRLWNNNRSRRVDSNKVAQGREQFRCSLLDWHETELLLAQGRY